MPKKDTNKKILEQAKIDHKAAKDAEYKQRQREKDDLAYQIPENQWDAKMKEAREPGNGMPGRPMLSISQLTQPIQLIINQAANAHLGVEIHPVSEEADEKMAETKQGLYRRIERDSGAPMARLWALSRAAWCGRGWYCVRAKYDEDSDETGDQEIVIERILDQDAVHMDPTSQQPDYSDARWGEIIRYVPLETFKREFPGAEVPTGDKEFASWSDEEPDWVKEVDGEQCLLVAERWYKEYDRDQVTGVKYCKVTAREVIEGPEDWVGHARLGPAKYIPIIPVIGRELQSFDGERRWEGVVRQARDGQQMVNYAASNLVEVMALEPKAPWVGAEGQFDEHPEWDEAHYRNFAKLEYKPKSHDGLLVPPPARSPADTSKMTLALQALAQAKDFVQSTTAVFAPSLGELPAEPTAQSGRAILALQQQTDAGTSHFIQNLANVSMAYEARVVLDMMPRIYDRPGRVTQILTGEQNKNQTVMLGQPYTLDDNGRPQPIPIDRQGRIALPPGAQMPENIKWFDLSKGRYSVSVSVGKSYQTRLQEGREKNWALLEKAPQLMPVIGDLVMEFDDAPGHGEIADRLRRWREKTMPGLGEDEDSGPSPEQLKGMLEQMGQELQQTKEQLAQAVQKIETDFAKQQVTLQKSEMDNTTRELIARMDNQTKLMQEFIKAQTKTSEGDEERTHDAESQEFEAATDMALEQVKQGAQEREGDRQERMAEKKVQEEVRSKDQTSE